MRPKNCIELASRQYRELLGVLAGLTRLSDDRRKRRFSANTAMVRLFEKELRDLSHRLEVTTKQYGMMLETFQEKISEYQSHIVKIEDGHRFIDAALRHLPVGILIVDASSGQILFQNRQLVDTQQHDESRQDLLDEARTCDLLKSGRNLRHWPGPALARAIVRGDIVSGEEIEYKREDGTRGALAVSVAPIRETGGRVSAAIAVFQDITERREAEERIRHLALHDALTGLPNRTLLTDRLAQALARARRGRGAVAAMLLDLDGFKDINDTLGHAAGDRLLRAVADRISSVIRASDTMARLGGDEFAFVLRTIRDQVDAACLAARVLDSLCAPFDLDGQDVHISASIGIAMYPGDGQDPDTLLKNADLALYLAKARCRRRFCFFESSMDEEAQARQRTKRELWRALERNELELHYQPQLDFASGRIIGVEALARWRHPKRGLLLAGEFIPVAEATGLIRPLGDWVLREACRQARIWRTKGRHLTVAINLSPAQLRNGHMEALATAIAQAELEPDELEVEITEGVLMDTSEHNVNDFLKGLLEAGVRLTLDDFGVGYSSLAYLRHLPVQTIKIDRSFVCGLSEKPHGEALMRAIVALGHSTGKRVVAEGVENVAQLKCLRRLGCDGAQGFLIAVPQAVDQLEHLLDAPFAGLSP